MNPPLEPAELRELMLRHLEGETSPEEAHQLSFALRGSPKTQREFAELLVQLTQLRGLGHEQNMLTLDQLDTPQARNWWSGGVRWAAAVAACFLAVAAWLFFTRGGAEDADEQFAEGQETVVVSNGVAMLTRCAGAVWEASADADREVGATLEPSLLRLKSGVVQVEFFSGARVILEGPAEFEVISSWESRLNYGKLNAVVPPPARGFKVHTERLVLIDIGTEFGIKEQPGEPQEVHVFKGKVQLEFANTNQAPRELTEGKGARVETDEVDDLPADPAAFVRAEELQKREADELRARLGEWRSTSQKFAADPALLVYFNFEDGKGRNGELINRAKSARTGTGGTVVGCDWSEGRWPGKSALQFANRGDRVRLKVPGEFESLTYAAWVSIEGLSRPNNALTMSQRFAPGDVRWEITSAGSLRLTVRPPGDAEMDVVSSPRLLKSQSGRWVHLAAVYNGPERKVALYVNGKRVAEKTIAAAVPLVLDDVELGNWNPMLHPPASASERKERQRPSFKFREFHGRMDEFALLSRPLSADEIRKLYESGKPRKETVLATRTNK